MPSIINPYVASAIELKFDITPNLTSIYFYDLTGAINQMNLGGYGTPNPEVADIQWATVEITKRGSSTTYTINVFSELPTVDKEQFSEILGSDFGETGDYIDPAIYHVKYTIGHYNNGNAVIEATEENDFFFGAKLKCCLSTIRKSIPLPGSNCDCKDKKIEGLANASVILEGICELVGCDELDKADENITFLKNYCACNCASC